MGCGSPFQFQLEAPPFQFKYEQDWWKEFGRGINHICWVVSDAERSYDQLLTDGAIAMQEFTRFPTYDGFVAADPEGTWVEIMEYTTPQKVPQFVAEPVGLEGMQLFGGGILVRDLIAMQTWYEHALGLSTVFEQIDGDQGLIYMADSDYHPQTHNIVLKLSTPNTAAEIEGFERNGPHISALLYLAIDVAGAVKKADEAGLDLVSKPEIDDRTGVLTAVLREPNGNLIEIRKPFKS
jgi:catechol 2,3-dioxygenase-like lactoylglutathione lyase family enzyme